MIIENLIAFRKYMLTYYFDRHDEKPVVRGPRADNILIRDMTPYDSAPRDYKGNLLIKKTVAYYHLYLDTVNLDVSQFERPTDISKELRRHIIVLCKNRQSSGVLMAEYPGLLNNSGFIDYSKFKYSDPVDHMTTDELLHTEPDELIEDTGKI